MQNSSPAATASGSLFKTPFPHLLVYALERRLTGTFELSEPGTNAAAATILVQNGCPAKVRTAETTDLLGTVLVELEMVAAEDLERALATKAADPRRLGALLLEAGAIDPASLEAALRSQVERRVERLFRLPAATAFSYFDGHDALADVGGAPTPIDPFPVLWRGVRETPSLGHVESTLQRVAKGTWLRPTQGAELERFAFEAPELGVITTLQERPLRVGDLIAALGAGAGSVLAYFLLIMKQVDLLDSKAAGALPEPASSAVGASPGRAAEPPELTPLPISVPVPEPASSQAAISTPRIGPSSVASPPSSGQAFARLQLQRQASTRGPLVIEEHVAPPSDHDERASHSGIPIARGAFGGPPAPTPAPAPAPAASAPASAFGSLPAPRLQPPSSKSIVAAPAVDEFDEPTRPSAQMDPPARPAGVDPKLVKTKILERAERITSEDYFQMLGIERDAPLETVQRSFIALAKVWHPDRLPPALADVKEACSKVFSHLTEANATLSDPVKREEYMKLLAEGGATPEDQAKIQSIIDAAMSFQKADMLLKRNPNDPNAYEIVARCVRLDDQPDYLATLAWLDAQKPDCQARDKLLEKIDILSRCIERSPRNERSFFYRGQLYKRVDDAARALDDFKRAAELNPRNLDATREVRVYAMRQAAAAKAVAAAAGPAPAAPSTTANRGASLFGKLFKK